MLFTVVLHEPVDLRHLHAKTKASQTLNPGMMCMCPTISRL